MPQRQHEATYIATQGPLPQTVPHFWNMVWQSNSTTILMLAKLVEDGKIKVAPYYPTTEDPLFCVEEKNDAQESFEIQLKSCVTYPNKEQPELTVRVFEMRICRDAQNGTKTVLNSRTITQFHYLSWPDHGVPTIETWRNFYGMYAQYKRQQSCQTPVIVHCSAGVGRTGTFIAFDQIIERFKEGDVTISACRAIDLMRRYRPKMVQTQVQLGFLLDALNDVIRFKQQ